jgi:hypothetical protein
MTYQVAGKDKVSGYLAALDARVNQLHKDDAEKFLRAASSAANARLSRSLSAEAREELEYVLSQISERYFRLMGWLA